MRSRVDLEQRVATEIDDVLGTIALVDDDATTGAALQDTLFERLVDLLIESAFCELRSAHVDGDLNRAQYLEALATLGRQCREAGLLPLPYSGR